MMSSSNDADVVGSHGFGPGIRFMAIVGLTGL